VSGIPCLGSILGLDGVPGVVVRIPSIASVRACLLATISGCWQPYRLCIRSALGVSGQRGHAGESSSFNLYLCAGVCRVLLIRIASTFRALYRRTVALVSFIPIVSFDVYGTVTLKGKSG
jgi:hypothetical protein